MTPANELLGFSNLILPALVAGGIAWALPLVLARLLPETLAGLALNTIACLSLLLAAAWLFFAYSYASRGIDVTRSGAGAHFLRLAGMSALLWAPISAAVLLQIPRRWRPEL